MSAPYSVSYGYGDGYRQCDDLDDAIAFALSRPNDISVSITGDGADCDMGPHGYVMTDDGLTDSERERIEEAGLA